MDILKFLLAFIMSWLKLFEPDPCNTPECYRTATFISNNIDTTVNPCDDFYKFACGNFIKNNKIADDQVAIATTTATGLLISKRVLEIITEPFSSNDTNSTMNMKKFYKSCMNEAIVEQNGLSAFQSLIKTQLGDWPILLNPSASITYKDPTIQLSNLFWFNSFPIFAIVSDLNRINPVKGYNLTITQSNFVAATNLLNSPDYVNSYKKFIRTVVEYFGVNNSTNPKYLNDIDDIVDLETQLSKYLDPLIEVIKFKSDFLTIAELESKLPDFEWRKFIMDGYFGPNSLLKNISFNSTTDKLILQNFDYVSNATKIFKNATINQRRTLENYMIWSVVKNGIRFLPAKFRQAEADFRKSPLPSRQDFCIEDTKSTFVLPLSRIYINKYFNKSVKTNVEKMISLKTNLEQCWMRTIGWTAIQRRMPKRKYPPVMFNDTFFENRYGKYNMDENNYLGNTVSINNLNIIRDFEKLGKNKSTYDFEWELQPIQIQAKNDYWSNQIYVPAGILESPYFSLDFPNYINYGSLAFIIGHEITHGFDSLGRTFDKYGNKVEDGSGLWSNQTIEKFLEKSKCFINQYGNYTVEQVKLNLNGELTLMENIADNGGLKEGFRAYKNWEKMNGKEKKLPGLDYTSDQMYFIGLAQAWCMNVRDQVLITLMNTDFHSVSEARINVPVSNFDEFSKAFKCKISQPKVQQAKCSVW